jgi:hypothetical protein
MSRRLRLLAVAGVVSVLVAGVASACGSASGGSARLIDDTGRPDVADGGGWVALVPADRADDLWDAAGAAPTDDLRYAGVPLTRAQVESVGGVAEPVSEDGDFELGLTGRVLLCRVPGGEEPSSTRGCAVVDLAEDDGIEITWGEGGLGAGDDRA